MRASGVGGTCFGRLESFGRHAALALHQDLDLALRLFQLTAAGVGQAHAFLEESNGGLQGKISPVELAHDLFETGKALLEAPRGRRGGRRWIVY